MSYASINTTGKSEHFNCLAGKLQHVFHAIQKNCRQGADTARLPAIYSGLSQQQSHALTMSSAITDTLPFVLPEFTNLQRPGATTSLPVTSGLRRKLKHVSTRNSGTK
ncbi:MAG: hypothetical protein ACOY4H_11525 [Thermodesulfobacteriota bacterium]